MRTIVLVLVVLLATLPAVAQIQTPPPGGSPVFHGVLEVFPANGTINRTTGSVLLRVRHWRLLLVPGSNGISPATERVLIAVGQGQNDFFLPPGSMVSRRHGTVFTYRGPRGTTRGVRSIRIAQVAKDADGIGIIYRVNFTLTGVVLSDLLYTTRPDCMPLAVIVGDDDGFSGVQLAERNLKGRRVAVASSCSVGGDWPWLGR